MFKMIVALDEERGIGKNNSIPWFIPGELGWVAKTTKATSSPKQINALIMGRKTWESLPEDKRPLPDRINIVVTRDSDKLTDIGIQVCSSLEEAFALVESTDVIEDAFIFGGAGIYEEALKYHLIDEVLLTHVPGKHDADTFFPELPPQFSLSESSTQDYGDVTVRREIWTI